MDQQETQSILAFTKKLVVSELVDGWKKKEGPLGGLSPVFEPSPADLPAAAEAPNLKVCRLSEDNMLVLPLEVRERFLTDPIRGSRWREVLKAFDKAWSIAAPPPLKPSTIKCEEDKDADPELSWNTIFTEEVRKRQELENKYQDVVATIDPDEPDPKFYVTIVKDGDVHKIFVVAKKAVEIPSTDYFFGHGAGSWINGGVKAMEAMEKGCTSCCKFEHATDLVVRDTASGKTPVDSAVMTLHKLVQTLEGEGHINFTVAGHSMERPAEVLQGGEGDKLHMKPQSDHPLVWKDKSVKAAAVKMTNVGSFIQDFALLGGGGLQLVWRMRYYKREGLLAPAKPLWYLRGPLSLVPDEAQRIV